MLLRRPIIAQGSEARPFSAAYQLKRQLEPCALRRAEMQHDAADKTSGIQVSRRTQSHARQYIITAIK